MVWLKKLFFSLAPGAKSIFFALFGLFSPPSQAKTFENSYISFEIPETWECKAFGTDWVCHSKFQEKKVEALITSTAKIAGASDTLAAYQAYLQQAKTWSNLKKEQVTSSKISPARKVFIKKFPWIDSIHKNSEIKSYISRYAGTVCCPAGSSKLGILVVLSAHQDHYTKYSGEFIKTVKSLRVMDIEKAIPKIRAAQARGAGGGMTDYLEGLFEDEGAASGLESSGEKIFGLAPLEFAGLGGAGLAFLAYFIFKKRKGQRRRRRSRRRR